VVDAILGTGSSGAPRGPAAAAIGVVNEAAGGPVLACDLPSGVDAATGEVAGLAVAAAHTVTFHGEKVGLRVAPGAFRAGTVEVAPIGVPRGAPLPTRVGLVTAAALAAVPRRAADGSKFNSGTVVIAGGAAGMTGAPSMAALAAMRSGAGYVQLAVPAGIRQVLELRLMEAMTRGLPEHDGGHVEEGSAELVRMAGRAGAVVLGPGLGRTPGAIAFARRATVSLACPLVLDADGLNAHAGAIEGIRERSGATVLTPHAAELGRLLERSPEDVGAHRLACVTEAAERSGAVVLLKGHDTLVAAPGGPVAVNSSGSPALATAGTGDVLAGVIGALLAGGLDPFRAACAAAYVHGLAGRLAGLRVGDDHTVAGDVIEALPGAFSRARRPD